MTTKHSPIKPRAVVYFLVETGQPILRVQKYFVKYNKALSESIGLNCLVTNGSWLHKQGVNLEIQTQTKKSRGAEFVAGVSIDGIPLASG